MITCPKCSSANNHHVGTLVQLVPNGAMLEPPAELRRCDAVLDLDTCAEITTLFREPFRRDKCGCLFRADGRPFDEAAHNRLWARARDTGGTWNDQHTEVTFPDEPL